MTRLAQKTGTLVGTVYLDDTQRVYFRDKEFKADYDLVKKKLAGKQIAFGGSTADERKWMIVASDDTEPGERHLFDRARALPASHGLGITKQPAVCSCAKATTRGFKCSPSVAQRYRACKVVVPAQLCTTSVEPAH